MSEHFCEYDHAMKTGNRAYANYAFEVILTYFTYFDVSPEAALELVYQRAAEFAKDYPIGGRA